MKYLLDGRYGEFAPGLLLYLIANLSGHIDNRKRSVVSKREPVGISGLPVLKPGVLLGVAVKELDLGTGMVDKKNLKSLSQ